MSPLRVIRSGIRLAHNTAISPRSDSGRELQGYIRIQESGVVRRHGYITGLTGCEIGLLVNISIRTIDPVQVLQLEHRSSIIL